MAKLGSLYFSILYKDDPKQLEAIRKRALKQLKKLEVKLNVSATTNTSATAKRSNAGAKATQEEIGYIEQLIQRTKELEQQYKSLPKAADAKPIIQEFSQVKKELDEVGKSLVDASKKQNLAEGSILSYRAELSKLIYEYDRLSAAEREAAAGKELLKNIQQTTIKLNEAEQASMRYQRNVGNYKSGFNGLTFQVQQLARELPSIAYGANIFFAAISNNAPMFADEVKRANEEYKILRQQQRDGMNQNIKAIPVWRQVAASIFSWQTAFVAVVTVMTFFGAKIFEAIGNMLKFGSATKLTKKEIKELNEEFAKAAGKDIAQLDILFDRLKRATEGTAEWNDARADIINQYGEYLSGMNLELSGIKNQTEAYKLLTQSIYENAKSKAINSAIEAETTERIEKQKTYYDDIAKSIKGVYGDSEAGRRVFQAIATELETSGRLSDELRSKLKKTFDDTVTVFNEVTGDYVKNTINPVLKNVDELIKIQDKSAKKIKDIGDQYAYLGKTSESNLIKNKAYWENQLSAAQNQLDLMDDSLIGTEEWNKKLKEIEDIKAKIALRDKESTNETNATNDILKDRVALLMEANSMYEEWVKIAGSDRAKSVAKAIYPEFNPDTLRSELEKIRKTGSTQARVEAAKALTGLDRQSVETTLADVERQITETIAKWGLFSKLYKESGDYSFAINAVFGGKVGFKSVLEQLQKEIEDEIKGNKVGISFTELIKADPDTVAKMFGGKTSALVKAYQEESKKLSDESLMRAAELLSIYKNYEQRRKDIIAQGEQDVADLIKNGASQAAVDESRKRTKEALASLDFERFKESDTWVMAFEDIDRLSTSVIESIISDLEKFKASAGKSLPINEFKELMSVLKKLRSEYESRNPFKSLTEGISEYIDALKELKDARANLSIIEAGGKVINAYGVKSTTTTDESGALPVEKTEIQGISVEYKSLAQAQTKATNAGIKLEAAENKIADAFRNAQPYLDLFSSTLGSLGSMFEALGNEDVADSIGYAMDAISSVSNIGEGFAKGGIVGGIGAAMGEVAGWVGRIAQAHDKKLDKAIKKSEAEVRKLEAAYQSIEESLRRSLGNQKELLAEQKKNLELQLKQLEIQRKAEEAKKNTDKKKLEDYDAAIREAEEELRYFAEEAASDLLNIDFKNWASQLGDALFEAWKKGEDGAEAFRKTSADILAGVMNDMLKMQILEPMMEKARIALFGEDGKGGYFGRDYVLDEREMQGLAKILMEGEKKSEAYYKALDSLNKYMEDNYGVSLKEKPDKEEGGLAAGIKGITEDTASLLASYVNGIRADIAMQLDFVKRLIDSDMPEITALGKAQLIQLQNIARNTEKASKMAEDIMDFLNSVSAGTKSLKVK
jgi:hypothetical protein